LLVRNARNARDVRRTAKEYVIKKSAPLDHSATERQIIGVLSCSVQRPADCVLEGSIVRPLGGAIDSLARAFFSVCGTCRKHLNPSSTQL